MQSPEHKQLKPIESGKLQCETAMSPQSCTVSSIKPEVGGSKLPLRGNKVERQKRCMIIYGQKRTNPHCGKMIEFTSAVVGLVNGSASWCSVET